jgi:transposase
MKRVGGQSQFKERRNCMIAVGIDVSKGKSTVAVLSDLGKPLLSPRDYPHNEDGLNEFCTWLHSLNDEVRIVMEFTGYYHYSIRDKFIREGFFVSVVNPYLMKKFNDGSVRKGKTDKKDAVKIATYCVEKWNRLEPWIYRDEQYETLRFLSRQYHQMISLKTKQKVQLDNLFDLVMPGIKKVFLVTNRPTSCLALYDFVEKFRSWKVIKNMTYLTFENRFIAYMKKKGYRPNANKAQRIYALAQNSILPREADSCTRLILKQRIQLAKSTESASAAILTQMQEVAKNLPEYELVHSFNGVGDILTPLLIAEIGDIRRFTSGKALNAYAGNDAPPFQSGTYMGTRRHISKRGSTLLRKVGYEVILALKISKPIQDPVYQFILKKQAEGKPKMVANMAGLNKFLRIYFARVTELFAI